MDKKSYGKSRLEIWLQIWHEFPFSSKFLQIYEGFFITQREDSGRKKENQFEKVFRNGLEWYKWKSLRLQIQVK